MGRLSILIGIILMAPASASHANVHTAKDGSKVFIIQSKEKPANILPAKKAAEGKGIMMRMPNLDETSVFGAPASNKPDEKTEKQMIERKKGKSKSLTSKKREVTTLRFSKAKIKGALRLPRVKFSKVGPSVDIREEIPDIDFNQKTLTESGF